MKHALTHVFVVLAMLAPLAAAPASAQTLPSFDAEIDCGGLFAPGDSVPFRIRVENQTLDSIPLDASVSIQIPFIGNVTLFEPSFTLGPDQDLAVVRQLNLPPSEPRGPYDMMVVANSVDETSFDTCSFDVQ